MPKDAPRPPLQARSIVSPEKKRLTIEKFLQANVHGTGPSPMDVDAFDKTKGGKGKKEQTKEASRRSFTATATGVAICRRTVGRRLLGSQKYPSHREGPIRNQGAKAKEAKARGEHHPLMSGQKGLQVSSSMQSADTEGATDKTGEFGKRSGSRRSVSGRLTRMEALAPLLSTLRWLRELI